MKKIFLILAIIILAVILETSVLPVCFSGGSIPDLTLVLLVAGVAVFGFQSVWIWGIIAGFILDIFSFRKIGISIFSFVIFSYSISFFSRRLVFGEKTGGIFASTSFVVLMTIVNNAWQKLASSGFKLEKILSFEALISWEMIWKALFNLILFYVIVILLKKQKRKIGANNLFYGK
jgi:rod shape-determining protein MreD